MQEKGDRRIGREVNYKVTTVDQLRDGRLGSECSGDRKQFRVQNCFDLVINCMWSEEIPETAVKVEIGIMEP